MSETILEEAQRLVYGDRQDDYGHPADDFAKTAKMWTGILLPKLRPRRIIGSHVEMYEEITPTDVAFCMVAVKLSREVHKHGRDNLVDAAGYIGAAAMIEEARTHSRKLQSTTAPIQEQWEKCDCLEVLKGHWGYIEFDRIALFPPLKGYTAKKHCPICGGTGRKRKESP